MVRLSRIYRIAYPLPSERAPASLHSAKDTGQRLLALAPIVLGGAGRTGKEAEKAKGEKQAKRSPSYARSKESKVL